MLPLFLAALPGLLVLAGLAAGLIAAVRWILRDPHGPAAMVILLSGLVLMLSRSWDAPFRSGDEITNFASSLVGAMSAFDLVEYPHPALYFNAAASLHALALAGAAVFKGGGLAAVAGTLLERYADLLFVSRALSSLAWLGVAVVAWRMALAVCRDRGAALLALALVIPVELEYPTSFSPYSLGVLLSYLLVYVALFRGPRPEWNRREAAILGALAGVAVGSHYLAALFVGVIPAVILMAPRRRSAGSPAASLAVFAGVAALAFMVSNPRVFLNLDQYFLNWVYRFVEIREADPRRVGSHAMTWTTHGASYYLGILSGRELLALAMAGAVAALAGGGRDRRMLAAVGVPAGLLLVLSLVSTRYLQYLLFVYPGLAVLSALALSAVMEPAGSWRPPARAILLAALALCGATTWTNAQWTYPADQSLRATDPVLHFETWLGTVPPPGADVGVTSPNLALFEKAVSTGRAPVWLTGATAARIREVAGQDVRWVKLADLNTGHVPDWLYLVEWRAAAGVFLPSKLPLEAVSRSEVGEFVHTVFRRLPEAGASP